MAIVEIKRWNGFSPPNPAMLRLLLENEGYQVIQWNDSAATYYGWHFHLEEQVHWVLSGEIEFTVQENHQFQKYVLKAGDRDLMKPNLKHLAKVLSETGVLYLIGTKKVSAVFLKPEKKEKVQKTKRTSTTPKTTKNAKKLTNKKK